MTEPFILKDFGEGLILRRATPRDVSRLSAFNARIHGDDPYDAEAVAVWTRDLLSKPHPTFQPGDFLIVENYGTGEIVSSMCLISQTWTYEGVPFQVGRPELVGTDPTYRNQGFVRTQFEMLHEWSRQRGELAQVITGIPYYYRQFGYEMTLDLGGGRFGYEPNVPRLKEGQEEPYRFRPAQESDLPFLMRVYALESSRSMIGVVREEADWRYEIFEKSRENVNRYEVRIIETADGRPVGYLVHPSYTWNRAVIQCATGYGLAEGVSYLAVTPSVLRYLWETGVANAAAREKKLGGVGLWLGADHPAYRVAASRLVQESKPYAFYVRVPDLPAFLNQIRPVLEKRLRQSACVGYTGALKINFYRDGACLNFQEGRLLSAERWKPKVKEDEGMSSFPGLTFLQLLFGYRSLAELKFAFPDCSANDEATALLEALFPKKYSDIWSIS